MGRQIENLKTSAASRSRDINKHLRRFADPTQPPGSWFESGEFETIVAAMESGGSMAEGLRAIGIDPHLSTSSRVVNGISALKQAKPPAVLRERLARREWTDGGQVQIDMDVVMDLRDAWDPILKRFWEAAWTPEVLQHEADEARKLARKEKAAQAKANGTLPLEDDAAQLHELREAVARVEQKVDRLIDMWEEFKETPSQQTPADVARSLPSGD